MKYFQFKYLLQQEGWLQNVYLKIDEQGIIQSLSTAPPDYAVSIEYINGFALPGFQNAHSHAFQFGMAGMAEKHEPGTNDDFWSWREAMYECALSMNPDEMEQVATACYKQMLRKGYTHVAEFHYLHHDKNGKPYANLAEMGERLLAAAVNAGIKITLVPVFYQQGGFGKDPQPRQRRFISQTIDDYFQLLDDTAHAVSNCATAKLGFGVHSLRAVKPEDVMRTFEQGPKDIPFHLHAAEQLKEVDDCIASLNKRPIEWLLENLPLNDRFHIVHCTHMNDREVHDLAKSGANAVLCPGTEGNLGDGIFRLTDFYKHGGSWSIGTDSHISLNPLEDLRWLDYAQRFTTHRRNTFDDGASVLINKTLIAGRKAMGNQVQTYFEVAQPLDAVVYNEQAPLLKQAGTQHGLSALLYTADSSAILGTLVDGRWIV
ncbi:MAG: formimidoylglutamate deiminase [Cyclobacteriaceae bacterium]|nr:formimidoylglutamate deiminase [Cyclobacteriaceae bacterium]